MIYSTKILAINPLSGELEEFCGPEIEAPSWDIAEEYLQKNGLGYCEISGKLNCSIPCDDNFKTDNDKKIDYDILNQN